MKNVNPHCSGTKCEKKFLRAIKSHTEIERGEIGLENWLIESGRFRATHSTGDDSAVLNDENSIKIYAVRVK